MLCIFLCSFLKLLYFPSGFLTLIVGAGVETFIRASRGRMTLVVPSNEAINHIEEDFVRELKDKRHLRRVRCKWPRAYGPLFAWKGGSREAAASPLKNIAVFKSNGIPIWNEKGHHFLNIQNSLRISQLHFGIIGPDFSFSNFMKFLFPQIRLCPDFTFSPRKNCPVRTLGNAAPPSPRPVRPLLWAMAIIRCR